MKKIDKLEVWESDPTPFDNQEIIDLREKCHKDPKVRENWRQINKMIYKTRTFIDLFAGIGGFRLALEKKGLECIFSSEIDRYARASYKANFKKLPSDDITQIPFTDIPYHDILCAGFPCQPFSLSGLKGKKVDPRSNLFDEIIRITNSHRPMVLLLENVRHILKIDQGRVFESIKQKIKDAGYQFNYSILNSSDFGIPQARVRVYFVCIRNDLKHRVKYSTPRPHPKRIFLKDVLEEKVDPSLFLKPRDDIRMKENLDNRESLSVVKLGEFGNLSKNGKCSQNRRIHSINGHATTQTTASNSYYMDPSFKAHQGQRIYSKNGHAITQNASSGRGKGGWYFDKGGIRMLSPLESKRVMGFPDSHKVLGSATQQRKQIGNAVIPKMIEYVFDSIKIKEI